MRSMYAAGVVAAGIMLGISGLAYAHVGSQSFEQAVGGYAVDIGYDAAGLIQVGDSVRFDFNLWHEGKIEKEPVPFAGVWVQILAPEKRVLFAGDIRDPEFGRAGLSFRFLKAGTYTLSVRFEKEGDELTTLAEAAFPFQVVAGKEAGAGAPSVIAEVGAGVIIGAILTYFFLKRRRT